MDEFDIGHDPRIRIVAQSNDIDRYVKMLRPPGTWPRNLMPTGLLSTGWNRD